MPPARVVTSARTRLGAGQSGTIQSGCGAVTAAAGRAVVRRARACRAAARTATRTPRRLPDGRGRAALRAAPGGGTRSPAPRLRACPRAGPRACGARGRAPTVGRIADERMTDRAHVHADLMRAPGVEAALRAASHVGEPLERRDSACAPACRARRPPSACAAVGWRPIGASTSPAARDPAVHEREVLALDRARLRAGAPDRSARRASSPPPAGRWCPCRADARCRRAGRRRAPARDAAGRSAACRPGCRCPDAPPARPACRRPGRRRPRARSASAIASGTYRSPATPADGLSATRSPPHTFRLASAAPRRPSPVPARTQACSRLRECSGKQARQRLVEPQAGAARREWRARPGAL